MDVTLRRGGQSLSLTDNSVCVLTGYDGTGEAPVRRLEERGPQQHGVTDVGFRLDPREIQLAVEILAASFSDLESRRRTLVDFIRPARGALTLRFSSEAGDVYAIDGHSLGSLTLPVQGGDGCTLRSGLVFRCPDPTFYDPVAQVATFSLGGGGTGMPVPLLVPITVGASAISDARIIAYAGTWRSLPVIRITGPITDCVISNVSTDEALDFDGVTIADGDWYEIDLRYGIKTVVDASGTNKVADLTPESALATWHLADDSEVPGGVNSLLVTGSGVDAGTRIDVTYYERYSGI